MSRAVLGSLLRYLRQFHDLSSADATDGELLRRFAGGDEVAFAALVRRHAPLVWGVCRRLLDNEQDAEDTFQATFLVLMRKAESLRAPQSLAAFLHGVASRIAHKARVAAQRRRCHEARAESPSPRDLFAVVELRELRALLDEELLRLPEKYRAPLVLCYLEGLSYSETARQLSWREGTVCGRLARAREMLRQRLSRRGLTLSGATLMAVLTEPSSAPAALVAAVGRMAALFALGQAAGGGAVSTSVATLAQDALQAMSVAKVKTVVALVAVFCVLTGGGGLAAHRFWTAKESPLERIEAPPAAKDAEQPRKEPLARTDRYGDPLPNGAVARLGTIRFRHDHPYLFLLPAFSPDGKILATGGNGEIRLWDSATGKLLREIRDGYGYSQPFFAPDGRWLAARLAEREVRTVLRLWNPQTGRRLLDIPTDGGAQACSPDGKRLAAVATDGSVSLWDTATGKRAAHLRGGHKKHGTNLAFTADGKSLVTFCWEEGRVCHWDLTSGRLEKTVELMIPRRVQQICLSPDGQSLAVSPRDRGPVFLLNTTTGKERVQLQGALARGVFWLDFSPDGKTLATSPVDTTNWGDQTEVALWDTGTGKLLRHLSMPARTALRFCFTPDGRTLAIAGQQPLLHLWDVATGKPIHNWSAHEGAITALAFTPDGRTLVSGGNGQFDGSVRLWDAKTGRHLRELPGHRWGVTSIALTPDGKTVVSGGYDGCIRLQRLDGEEGRRILLGRPPEGLDSLETAVYALGISPDGKTAATFGSKLNERFFYHVWDLSTGKAILERRDPTNDNGIRTFSPDAKLVARTAFGDADWPSGKSGGSGGVLPPGLARAVVEDVASGKQLMALALPNQAGGIVSLAADGRSFLTSSSRGERRKDGWHFDNTLHLCELASGKERQTITWSGRGLCRQAALAPDGRTAATARDDLTIQLWDLANGKELLRRDGFFSLVECLAFSPDGRSLASGHLDGTILVWDVGVVGGRPDHPEARPGQRQIEECWSDLVGEDAVKAYRAVWRLAAVPGQTLSWLRDHLQPAREVPADQLRAAIADLDSSDFSQRQAASERLTSLADRAGPALRAALKGGVSAEQRRRIEEALASLTAVPPAKTLRDLRAVEVLERIGTQEAKELLEKLAQGAPEARLTREAKAALQRVTSRAAAKP